MHTGWPFVTHMHRTRAPQTCQVTVHTLQSTHAQVHLNFPSQKCIRPTYGLAVLYCTESLPLWFWCKASASSLSVLASSYSSIDSYPRHASASKGVRDTPQTFAPWQHFSPSTILSAEQSWLACFASWEFGLLLATELSKLLRKLMSDE